LQAYKSSGKSKRRTTATTATTMHPHKSILKHEGVARQPSSVLDDDTREVCWGDLVIYEFPNILGDNPGVSDGAPLTIGWKHENKSTIGLDYYEYLRQNRPRRKRRELIMPSAARDT
jgi:hypothetical protein